MEYKYKKYLKFIILAVGFLISAAFYVKEDIDEVVIASTEGNILEQETNSVNENSFSVDDNINEDLNEELSEYEKELIKEYVRELLGEFIEAEHERKAADKTDSASQNSKIKIDEQDQVAENMDYESEMLKNKVNINIADKTELMSLNGIGEKKAEDIIKYRNEHGVFMSIEELKKVSGIKSSLFDRIKNSITV